MFLIQYKCCIAKRFSRCLSPRICWLYNNFLVNTTPWICWHYLLTRKGKSLNSFSLCGSYQAKITQAIRNFFKCEKHPSLLYLLVFFPDILRSCDPQICFSFLSKGKVSQKCRRKCHRSIKEKGTATNAKSLFSEFPSGSRTHDLPEHRLERSNHWAIEWYTGFLCVIHVLPGKSFYEYLTWEHFYIHCHNFCWNL